MEGTRRQVSRISTGGVGDPRGQSLLQLRRSAAPWRLESGSPAQDSTSGSTGAIAVEFGFFGSRQFFSQYRKTTTTPTKPTCHDTTNYTSPISVEWALQVALAECGCLDSHKGSSITNLRLKSIRWSRAVDSLSGHCSALGQVVSLRGRLPSHVSAQHGVGLGELTADERSGSDDTITAADLVHRLNLVFETRRWAIRVFRIWNVSHPSFASSTPRRFIYDYIFPAAALDVVELADGTFRVMEDAAMQLQQVQAVKAVHRITFSPEQLADALQLVEGAGRNPSAVIRSYGPAVRSGRDLRPARRGPLLDHIVYWTSCNWVSLGSWQRDACRPAGGARSDRTDENERVASKTPLILTLQRLLLTADYSPRWNKLLMHGSEAAENAPVDSLSWRRRTVPSNVERNPSGMVDLIAGAPSGAQLESPTSAAGRGDFFKVDRHEQPKYLKLSICSTISSESQICHLVAVCLCVAFGILTRDHVSCLEGKRSGGANCVDLAAIPSAPRQGLVLRGVEFDLSDSTAVVLSEGWPWYSGCRWALLLIKWLGRLLFTRVHGIATPVARALTRLRPKLFSLPSREHCCNAKKPRLCGLRGHSKHAAVPDLRSFERLVLQSAGAVERRAFGQWIAALHSIQVPALSVTNPGVHVYRMDSPVAAVEAPMAGADKDINSTRSRGTAVPSTPVQFFSLKASDANSDGTDMDSSVSLQTYGFSSSEDSSFCLHDAT